MFLIFLDTVIWHVHHYIDHQTLTILDSCSPPFIKLPAISGPRKNMKKSCSPTFTYHTWIMLHGDRRKPGSTTPEQEGGKRSVGFGEPTVSSSWTFIPGQCAHSCENDLHFLDLFLFFLGPNMSTCWRVMIMNYCQHAHAQSFITSIPPQKSVLVPWGSLRFWYGGRLNHHLPRG